MAELSETVHNVLHPHGKHGKVVMIVGGMVGLFLVYYLWKSRSSAAANANSAATPDLSGNGSTGDVGYLAGSGAGSSVGVPSSTGDGTGTGTDTSTGDGTGTGTDTSTGPDLTSNTGWEQAAVAFLVGKGTNGVNAQSAIEKYLNGDTLSYKDYGLINEVIASLGIAPQGTYGIPSFSGPPRTPTPSKPPVTHNKPNPKPSTHAHKKPHSAHHAAPKPAKASTHYVVKTGDTLSGIAAKHHTTWQVIYNKNKKAIGNNPNLIHTGLHLVI